MSNKSDMEKVLKGEDILISLPTEMGVHYKEENWKTLEKEKQELVKKWVRENLSRIKTINYRHTSYGLKHMCEEGLGFYVHNDVMKKALLLEGYIADTSRINWYFNISEKSFRRNK